MSERVEAGRQFGCETQTFIDGPFDRVWPHRNSATAETDRARHVRFGQPAAVVYRDIPNWCRVPDHGTFPDPADTVLARVRALHLEAMERTVPGCSDDLELFLADLSEALTSGEASTTR